MRCERARIRPGGVRRPGEQLHLDDPLDRRRGRRHGRRGGARRRAAIGIGSRAPPSTRRRDSGSSGRSFLSSDADIDAPTSRSSAPADLVVAALDALGLEASNFAEDKASAQAASRRGEGARPSRARGHRDSEFSDLFLDHGDGSAVGQIPDGWQPAGGLQLVRDDSF